MAYITNPCGLLAGAAVPHYQEHVFESHVPMQENALHMGNIGVPLPPPEAVLGTLTWNGSEVHAAYVLHRSITDIIVPQAAGDALQLHIGTFNAVSLTYSFMHSLVELHLLEEETVTTLHTPYLGQEGRYTAVAFDGICRALAKKFLARRKTDSAA
jgi:hypothetical protein